MAPGRDASDGMEYAFKCPGAIFVIPAKAGIQRLRRASWRPAFAGMTTKELVQSFLNNG